MAWTSRSLRADARRLRAAGWTYTEIVARWQVDHSLNPRVAMRLAHGLTQAEVAARWNELWPDPVPRTAKQISYWEIWPAPGGRTPSLETLNRLAMIYQCRAGDLLGGEDHSDLDPVADGRPRRSGGEAGQTIETLTVAIAVVLNGPDVLLVCRRDEHTGRWQFPAGVVKPGGDPQGVAVRETLSETGAHIAVRQHLGQRLHPLTKVMCEYFFCDFLGGEIGNRDVEENMAVAWVPRDRLNRYIPVAEIFRPAMSVIEGTD